MGNLIFLDIKKFKNIRDKNWEALEKLAEFYNY
jgi:hypothetical protein